MREHEHGHKMEHSKAPYPTLLIMLVLHFIVMYLVMYTMVSSINHVVFNFNQVYMTVMMVAPTALTMLLLMPSMHPNKKMNVAIYAASVAAFLVFFIFMRTQAGIGDKQFLKSMIPHHSGAILMCNKAAISDPEIVELCGEIVGSQQREIDQMKMILERL